MCSMGPTARARCATCSARTGSSSSTTSCSRRRGTRGARAARTSWTTSRVRCRTSRPPTRRSPPSRARRSRSSRRTARAWGGGSHGSRRGDRLQLRLPRHARRGTRAQLRLGGGTAGEVPPTAGTCPRSACSSATATRSSNYATYQRGVDQFLNTYNLLDLTPLGRNENGQIMSWLKYHDQYQG